MIVARILFLLGSVLALFGLWQIVAPYIYASVEPAGSQAPVMLIIGALLAWIGRRLERAQDDGADRHE